MEARKAGDGPAARALLFQTLAAQPEEPKQTEAEKLAGELVKGKDEAAKAAQEFLTRRDMVKELESLRAAVAKPGADKAKLIEAFPKDKQGQDFQAFAFETLATDPAGATKESAAYQHATAYLALTSEGPIAERAKKFLAEVNAAEGQAKSPAAAFKAAMADATGEAEVLKGVKVLSSSETAKGDLGRVEAKLEFTNPYTNKKQTAQVVLACAKRRDGWRVNWAKSDLVQLYPKMGQPAHNLSPTGIAGVASGSDSLDDLDKKLKLVPADALYADLVALNRKIEEQGTKPETEPKIHMYRAQDSDIVVVHPDSEGQHLVVFDPRYRLSSGLGVGNTVADFLASYDPLSPERAKSLYGSGIISMGVINTKGLRLEPYAIALYPKGSKKERLTIYLSDNAPGEYPSVDQVREDRVVGLGYVID